MHRTERQLSGPGAALALATLSIALQVAASLHAAEWPQVRVFTSAALRAVLRDLEPVFECSLRPVQTALWSCSPAQATR